MLARPDPSAHVSRNDLHQIAIICGHGVDAKDGVNVHDLPV